LPIPLTSEQSFGQKIYVSTAGVCRGARLQLLLLVELAGPADARSSQGAKGHRQLSLRSMTFGGRPSTHLVELVRNASVWKCERVNFGDGAG